MAPSPVGLPSWTAEELRRHLGAGAPVMVEWWADWCTNCAAQKKVVERLAPEFEGLITIGTIDVGNHPELAEEFGVQSLPTLAVFIDGREVGVLHGFRRAPEIRETVQRALAGAAPRRGTPVDDGQA